MTSDETHPMLHLPARDIPVPTSISEEAQAVLARGPLGPAPDYPSPEDLDGWRKMIADGDAASAQMLGGLFSAVADNVEEKDLGGFPVYIITPEGVSPDDRRTYLDIHGGAWIFGGGAMCRGTGTSTAAIVGARVWAVDYRMPPDHPYPTALDDCLAAYRALLEERRPEEIIVGGASAGGNLAAALMLRIRDEGLPLPAALVLSTPATDLTGAGDTIHTNLGLDTVLPDRAEPAARLYAGDHDMRDPYLSPVFGDFTKGYPPTVLLTGTRDLLLSDTVRLHRALRAAGVPAELHVFEAAGHGIFLGQAPEDREHAREIRSFADRHWAA